jgi:hypothetical protein
LVTPLKVIYSSIQISTCQKFKKRKYELDARNSVRNGKKNLEDAWLICEYKEMGTQDNFRESD